MCVARAWRGYCSYFETRNGMLGADYSSKFAPWLAHGCLSPRTIAHECASYEAKRVKNKSTYWMVFELIWRDYFRYYSAKQGRSIFMEGGPIGSHQSWRTDPQLLQRWKTGTLGVPLVDANMRELAATGFMSNRGRQNVASYLALDLQVRHVHARTRAHVHTCTRAYVQVHTTCTCTCPWPWT